MGVLLATLFPAPAAALRGGRAAPPPVLPRRVPLPATARERLVLVAMRSESGERARSALRSGPLSASDEPRIRPRYGALAAGDVALAADGEQKALTSVITASASREARWAERVAERARETSSEASALLACRDDRCGVDVDEP